MALLVTTLGYASAYKLASFIPDVSSYPFSLGWSEGSRYYYASLWLSKQVYGLSVPPSVLHPTRYLLQAFPFLVPGSSLWFNRFWQVFLWVVTTALTSYLLVRRLALPARRKPLVITLSMILWGFIFLFQGPVYYHLQFMVILILWGFDRHHFWRNLILVLIASLWAGISRINWLPVPGLLAAALYLMEVQGGREIHHQVPHPSGSLGAGRDWNRLCQPIGIPAVVRQSAILVRLQLHLRPVVVPPFPQPDLPHGYFIECLPGVSTHHRSHFRPPHQPLAGISSHPPVRTGCHPGCAFCGRGDRQPQDWRRQQPAQPGCVPHPVIGDRKLYLL